MSHLGDSTCGDNGSGNTQVLEVTDSQLDDAATSKLLDAKMESLLLSAGQLQLFYLAHTLLQQNKRIVLLDEVTSALDYATEDRLRAIL